MSVNNQCSICMENIVDKWVTKCDHSFCTKCIFDWINIQKNASCPLCRGPVCVKDDTNPVTQAYFKYDKNKFYIFSTNNGRCYTNGNLNYFNDLSNIVWIYYIVDENNKKRVKPSEFFNTIYADHLNDPDFNLKNTIINYKQRVINTVYNDINNGFGHFEYNF